jgi:DNA replication and repair protein RecF
MAINKLDIANFRNLSKVSLDFSPSFNLFYGHNGVGKTSLLEAIHVLTQSKSFRSVSNEHLIQSNYEKALLYGEAFGGPDLLKMGMEKNKKTTLLKVNGEIQKNVLQVLRALPVIVVNPDSYALVEEGPDIRRTFLNWGLFHVEPKFHETWRVYSRVLKQRNTALKEKKSAHIWHSFDPLLIENTILITDMRERYLQELKPIFKKILDFLKFPEEVLLTYEKGWDTDKYESFTAALEGSKTDDTQRGHTTVGAQRADVIFNIQGNLPKERLSRGQEKQLVVALRLAQGIHLKNSTQKDSIYLIDDLASELDAARRGRLFELLQTLSGQFFMTAIEPSVFDESLFALFPVEQLH